MSAHRTLNDIFRAFDSVGPGRLNDPGDTGTITVTMWGQICSVVTAAAETRTLARPTKPGILCSVVLDTDGGDLTLTVTGGYNADGDTSITFADAGDMVAFLSVKTGTTYQWSAIAHEGTNVASEDLSVDQLTVETIAVAAETAEHGAGVIGTGVAPVTYRYTVNGEIITDIKIDLTGLASIGGAVTDDVIGLAAGGVAYIGRNVVATNGVIYKIELICLETPATGDDDVNVVAAASAALAYDSAGGTTYGVNGGVAAAGQVVENLVQGLTANHYFYLTEGAGDTAGTYTAGQFIVRLHGHPLLT